MFPVTSFLQSLRDIGPTACQHPQKADNIEPFTIPPPPCPCLGSLASQRWVPRRGHTTSKERGLAVNLSATKPLPWLGFPKGQGLCLPVPLTPVPSRAAAAGTQALATHLAGILPRFPLGFLEAGPGGTHRCSPTRRPHERDRRV